MLRRASSTSGVRGRRSRPGRACNLVRYRFGRCRTVDYPPWQDDLLIVEAGPFEVGYGDLAKPSRLMIERASEVTTMRRALRAWPSRSFRQRSLRGAARPKTWGGFSSSSASVIAALQADTLVRDRGVGRVR